MLNERKVFCKKCKIDLPVDSFYQSDIRAGTKCAACKQCRTKESAKWRANNKDRWNELARQNNAMYREKNRAEWNARSAKYRAENPEKLRLQKAQYHIANREQIIARIKKWSTANPEAIRIYSHSRRARKREAGGKLSKDLADRLCKLQKGKCACCKQPLGDDFHLDHIMPLALGGANEDWNIQLLRKQCNLQKSAKHPIKFMQSKGFLL